MRFFGTVDANLLVVEPCVYGEWAQLARAFSGFVLGKWAFGERGGIIVMQGTRRTIRDIIDIGRRTDR